MRVISQILSNFGWMFSIQVKLQRISNLLPNKMLGAKLQHPNKFKEFYFIFLSTIFKTSSTTNIAQFINQLGVIEIEVL